MPESCQIDGTKEKHESPIKCSQDAKCVNLVTLLYLSPSESDKLDIQSGLEHGMCSRVSLIALTRLCCGDGILFDTV